MKGNTRGAKGWGQRLKEENGGEKEYWSLLQRNGKRTGAHVTPDLKDVTDELINVAKMPREQHVPTVSNSLV